MKRIYLTLLLSYLVLFTTTAQTPGELTVSVSTSETGGNYAPRNIIAIWIADDAGNFQKTLLAYAQTRKTHLNTWQAATSNAGTEFNVIDAITGATRTSHNTRECTWDGTDFNGQELPDGDYFVWMELTDKNGTGNFSSFPFTKSEELYFSMPSNVPSFSSISITWNPSDPTGITETGNHQESKIYPNPGTGIYKININQAVEIKVLNSAGELVLISSSKIIDISNQARGIYYFVIKTNKGVVKNKVIKN